MNEGKFIEIDGLTLELRDDGRVGIYSPNGFQIVEIADLPEPLARLIEVDNTKGDKVMSESILTL